MTNIRSLFSKIAKKINAREEPEILKNIFPYLERPEFSLVNFYKEHKSLIDTTPFNLIEFRKLKNNCWENFNSVNHKKSSCNVCYENLKPGDNLIRLPACQHTFHKKCLHSWTLEKSFCPQCSSYIRFNLYMMLFQGLGKNSKPVSQVDS